MNNKKILSLLLTASTLLPLSYNISAHASEQTPITIPELGSVYDANEQLKIAMRLIDGVDVKADFSTGVKWLKLAAAQKNPEALHQLALYYAYGVDDVAQDYYKAVELFEQAAKENYVPSQFALSALLLRVNTPTYNAERGLFWLEKAAENNDREAQYSLAMLYKKQETSEQSNTTKIMHWLTKAAQNGHKAAQYTLGVYYLEGVGVAKNPELAFTWFKQSADKGDAASQFNAGLMCEQGQGTTKDIKQAVNWYEKAAAQGESGAQFNLATRYLFGQDVPQDTAKGLQLLKQATDGGNPAALTLMGNLVQTGKFLSQNYRQAYQFYLTAAEKGYSEAQYQLALLYANGYGVEKSNQQSVYWIQKAALSNHAMAQYGLGAYLANGVGIEKNLFEAAYWLSLAAAHGQQHAIESRNSVLEQLSREEIDNLNKRIKLNLTTYSPSAF